MLFHTVWLHQMKNILGAEKASHTHKHSVHTVDVTQQLLPDDCHSVFVCRSGGGTGPRRLREPRLLLAVDVRHPHLELCWTHRHGGVGESLHIIISAPTKPLNTECFTLQHADSWQRRLLLRRTRPSPCSWTPAATVCTFTEQNVMLPCCKAVIQSELVSTDERLPLHPVVQSVLLDETPQHREEGVPSVSVTTFSSDINALHVLSHFAEVF